MNLCYNRFAMKKRIYKLAAMLAIAALLILPTGCAGSGQNDIKISNDGSSRLILCASFAEYDWTRNIIGENPGGLSLSLLNESGIDMHSYQPSVSDMVSLANCDLLIYTGGISEYWIDEAIASSERGGFDTLSLMEFFTENPLLFPEYEQDEHEHEHEHIHSHEHEDGDSENHDGHDDEFDEHIWLSLKMASVFCEKITEAISTLDPANEDLYRQNLAGYQEQLAALDGEFEEAVNGASADELLLADRFPFLYLSQDYGIQVHAAFEGCSAETEASFETIIDLAEDLTSEELSHILILKNSSTNLADTIIRAAKENSEKNSGKNYEDRQIKICELDSLQSVTAEDIAGGFSYLGAMKKNKEVISECLN